MDLVINTSGGECKPISRKARSNDVRKKKGPPSRGERQAELEEVKRDGAQGQATPLSLVYHPRYPAAREEYRSFASVLLGLDESPRVPEGRTCGEAGQQVPGERRRLQANVGHRDDFPERGLTHRADREQSLRRFALAVEDRAIGATSMPMRKGSARASP